MLYEKFEKNRTKTITNRCDACGTQLDKPCTVHDDAENPYAERLAQLHDEKNPYTGSAKDYSNDIAAKETAVMVMLENHDKMAVELDDNEALQDVISTYRSTVISNTIVYVEEQTNKLLTDHFDAEIKVAFLAEEADKLDTIIHKDGNVATFTQLSKGQRCLLKLCFGISVMQAVANHHGLKFDQVFFDESIEGLDDAFKRKAFGLFEALPQGIGSIFVVEHSSELKACFSNSYKAELINGESQIQKV